MALNKLQSLVLRGVSVRCDGQAVELCLGASEATAEELGWETGRSREVCFEVPRLPLSDGLFRLSVALGDPHSTRQYHRVDSAAEFTVFPDEHSRGWFRFEGDWSLVAAKRPARTV